MKLLLDTHILLWWAVDDKRLSEAVRVAISDERNEPFVSVATLWEIGIKLGLGRLQLPGPEPEFMLGHIAANGFTVLPISAAHALGVASLPSHHRDPFDRMLITQAVLGGLVLVSVDKAFRPYVDSLDGKLDLIG